VPGKKIFISYSNHDAAAAKKLCSELEKKGVDCCIIPRDIDPALNYAEAIFDAITESGGLLLVFSRNSNNSKDVLSEVRIAFKKDIPIFPLRIENTELSKSLEYFLGISQWLDAYESPLENYFPAITAAVSKLVKTMEQAENADGEKAKNNTPTGTTTPPATPGTPAKSIIQESETKPEPVDLRLQNTFRNPIEDNVEYIKVPGGSYIYSVSEKVETVPDLYFCKYPVTNKRYNRFIAYLEGKEKELERIFPLKMYLEKLPIFSESIPGFREWLGKNRDEWKEKLRSRIDDKKFLGDDQPVVCVTWFSARAYCSWLSCMEASKSGDKKMDDMGKLSGIYRLPTEVEWEWAAGGEPVGPVKPVREFPWPKEKGEPSVKLANYGGNVGTTTPVGRYPDGATPLGLMDMAGNVWEWMANDWDENTRARALRGGSWYYDAFNLRCSARGYYYPGVWLSVNGFRVVRSQLF